MNDFPEIQSVSDEEIDAELFAAICREVDDSMTTYEIVEFTIQWLRDNLDANI